MDAACREPLDLSSAGERRDGDDREVEPGIHHCVKIGERDAAVGPRERLSFGDVAPATSDQCHAVGQLGYRLRVANSNPAAAHYADT